MNEKVRQYSMIKLTGAPIAVTCPSWCTTPHGDGEIAENTWHEGPSILFVGPGDFYEYFDGGEPYEVMWAAISAEPNDADGSHGQPYIYFDTQGQATGARLDVAQADAVLRDLRQYVDRLQQMRDRLAQINEGER
ncbi:hypothetical protein PV350_13975 [Streptomyces sp. PA03-6a]|nr:hypothetical protein [Streptomyces sp. PA03-6a]